MAFDWKALVDLATILEQQAQTSANSEAYLRSAMSRLYFGVYGHARNYATNYLQFIWRNAAEDHGRLRQHLKGNERETLTAWSSFASGVTTPITRMISPRWISWPRRPVPLLLPS